MVTGGCSPRGEAPVERRLAVRVTRDAERQIRGGHPWVYDESITSVGPHGSGQPGDLAVVFDSRRGFVAIGLYDPASPIRVKILHHGKPTRIDRAWFAARFAQALERRAALVASPETTAYRVVHGENDQLPGLVLDRYEDSWVLKVYSEAWAAHLPTLVSIIDDLVGPDRLILRWSRNVGRRMGQRWPDGSALIGEIPDEPVQFLENGLRFEADLVNGQKTGYFLDQRDNRAMVRSLAGGRRVLDVFCCGGGFSVHAAAGGAVSVHSVDISPGAIEAARRNMGLNSGLRQVRACRHTTATGDAMAEMAHLARRGERFDLVVVDPPSFASRQTQVPTALRAYGRLTELAMRLLEPAGTLVQASCSSRVQSHDFFEVVERSARSVGRPLRSVRHTQHPEDHPIGFSQGAYLKAVFGSA